MSFGVQLPREERDICAIQVPPFEGCPVLAGDALPALMIRGQSEGDSAVPALRCHAPVLGEVVVPVVVDH